MNKNMTMNALDLTKEFPRSPRFLMAGFIIAARTLDKCRAKIAGSLGEYGFDCPLDNVFFTFTGISCESFKDKVATGASDEEMAAWISEQTQHISLRERVLWNNEYRYKRICEMAPELQEFLEGYIPKYLDGRFPNYWFDVYDIEEKRM
jgi:hypothetical protein